MQIGIPTEIYADEKRVATTPEVAGWLQKLGYSVAIEAGAGEKANFSPAPASMATLYPSFCSHPATSGVV
ncbi:MAG: hypothetical protein DRQ48_05860, partial [Gammaproteobacteria bacterium]